MIKFPESLPMDSFTLVIDKIRGKQDVGTKEFAQALWNIVGYAADQAISDEKPIFNDGQELDMEDFAACLEQALIIENSPDSDEKRKLPWANILKIGLKILISLFLL